MRPNERLDDKGWIAGRSPAKLTGAKPALVALLDVRRQNKEDRIAFGVPRNVVVRILGGDLRFGRHCRHSRRNGIGLSVGLAPLAPSHGRTPFAASLLRPDFATDFEPLKRLTNCCVEIQPNAAKKPLARRP